MAGGAGPRDPGRGRARSGGDDADSQILGLARGGGLNLIGAACNQLGGFGITMLVARELGRAQLGRYAQAYALMALLSLMSLSGLRTGMMRFVAIHRAERDPGAVRGVVRLGIGLTTGAALLLAVGLYVAAPWLARVTFHDEHLALALRFVAMTLPSLALTDSALAATQGYRTMKPYALIGLMFEPLARLGLTALLLSRGTGLRGAMAALMASNGIAAVLAVVALYRLLGAPTMPTRYSLRQLFRFSMVSWMAQLATTGLIWADTVLLGIFLSSDKVGVYNVATRLVTLATFVMPAINSSFGPRIADLYHRGQTDSLRRAYAAATSWILRLSLPAFVALIVFPGDLLGVFGRGFRVGATVTVILAIGKLIDAGTGPCGLMLNMSGRPLWNMIDNFAVLGLNIALNLVLIPRYGIVGSAVAWAISLGVVNVARLVQVWVALRMLPFDLGVLRGFVAGIGAFLAALLVRRWLEPPIEVPAGLAAIAGCYLLLVMLLGLSAEDRLVRDALIARLRPAPAAGRRRGRVLPGPTGELAFAGQPQLAGAGRPVPLQPAGPGRPRLKVGGRRPRTRPRLSPVRYARTLWRGAPVLLAGAAVGLVAGVFLLPPVLPTQSTYRASVVLEVRPFTVDLVDPGAGQGGWSREELAQSTLDPDVTSQVVHALGRKAGRLQATREAPKTAWPARLLARLEARPLPSSDREVELSYADHSEKLAAAVVNGYARRYVLARKAVDADRTATTLELLQRQASDRRTALAEWAQRVDQERASSPSGTVSTITQTELDLAKRRYDAKVAELQLLRDRAAIRDPVTEAHLPPAVRVTSRPPDPQLVAALAALLCLALAAGGVLLAEAAAPRVATAADAEAATGADVAVTIPRVASRRGPLVPAVEGDAFGAQAEAYRRLAGTLERRGVGSDAFVLTVTSADPGEGRSTVAVNLAHTLARSGHPVLLVSGDLGRPSMERLYGVDQDAPGLAEYLAHPDGNLVFLLVMVRENLMLLPAGMPVRNPAELLAGPRLERLMEDLRALGLIVVLDTPPARWAADALSVAGAADATLLVAHANRSRWRAVADLATSLRRDRVPVLGVALVGRRQRRLAGLARRAGRRWTARAPAVEPVAVSRSGEGRGRVQQGR
jgi:capsular exopolysaccharide synthesis family protein